MPQVQNGAADGFGEVRALTFDGDEWNAVHKEDNVEYRHLPGAALDPELVDNGEVIELDLLRATRCTARWPTARRARRTDW